MRRKSREQIIFEHLDQRLRRVEELVTRHQGQLVTIVHLALALAQKDTANEARNASGTRRLHTFAASVGRNAKRSTK